MRMVKANVILLLLFSTSLVSAQTYLIQDAMIHTLSDQGSIEVGSILITDGTVVAIGKQVETPAGALIIDGKNRVITPGLFHALSNLGIVEVGAEDSTVDNSHEGVYGPAFSVLDSYNPRSGVIVNNRIEGVTRAMLSPRASESQVVSGTLSVVQLAGTSDYVVNETAGVIAYLGERGANLAGGSRAMAMLHIKQALSDAEDYRDNQQDYDEGATREFVMSKVDMDALQPVLAADVPLLVGVNRASDITEALQLADEFAIDIVIVGGAEAWMVADELADAGVPVLLNPMQNLPDSFESLNSSLANAVKLDEAGVTIAFLYGDSHNARNLTQVAGNAVANGLPWETAMRAISVTPAELFSGDDADCCGLEVGSPADLVIWDGDPLEVTTFAEHVFIQGDKVSMKSRQTMLRDRYLDLEDAKPFPYRH